MGIPEHDLSTRHCQPKHACGLVLAPLTPVTLSYSSISKRRSHLRLYPAALKLASLVGKAARPNGFQPQPLLRTKKKKNKWPALLRFEIRQLPFTTLDVISRLSDSNSGLLKDQSKFFFFGLLGLLSMASTQLSEPRINIGPHPEEASSVHFPLEVNQIRFLTIFPALCLFDKICCGLRPVTLEDEAIATYEALSYTWDSDALSCTISVNNCPVRVTANLYEALRYLRDRENPRTLWVDALCINQHDMAERSVQVLFMGKIYSSVRRVIIWLGTEVEGGDAGLRILSERAPELSRKEIRANVGTLFERPWWYRSWTVQEFLNSRERTFVCGLISLHWDTVVSICDALMYSRDGGYDEYMHIYSFVASINSHEKSMLRQLMLDFGHCLATDPRDKVYAYLGLANDVHTIVPDYTASIQRVYTDLVKTYIEKEGNLEIICTHHRGYSTIDLPSWVPDWSICRRIRQNWTVNSMAESFFSAGYPPSLIRSRGTAHRELPSAEDISFEDAQSLVISGIPIGKISEAAHNLDPSLFDTNDWVTEIRSWKPKDLKSDLYLNGESKFRAFCRTMLTDCNTLVRYSFFDHDPKRLLRLEEELRKILSDTSANISDGTVAVLRRAAYSSRFAKLSSGHFALIPNASKIGDDVCVLLGCSTPMALRRSLSSSPMRGLPTENSSRETISCTYRMIGPCYVHGVMDGEMVSQTSKPFKIV